jgi:hypothetical protein
VQLGIRRLPQIGVPKLIAKGGPGNQIAHALQVSAMFVDPARVTGAELT